ncbi:MULTISPECIES: cytochrome P450 [unclassified Mycobacterium]|uniref:cytochrome P450 n=1 Tax=unclassified Mycobacterium TaxID=2642494 RepID=UPI0029C7A054|nr:MULTISPECIES: cytochrome P450 [unclassified Mycobacterium]
MRADELRKFVRTTDNGGYADLIMTESPRARVVDWYGPLSEALGRAPAHPCTQQSLVGLEDFRTVDRFTQNTSWACLLGYDEVAEGFSNRDLTSKIQDDTIGPVWGHTVIGMDGEEHRLHRGLIAQAFTRKAIQRWNDNVVAPIVDGLIDRFVDRGHADLAAEFTLYFPAFVITEMMGLPAEDVAQFHHWSAETIMAFHDLPRAMRASKHLEDYLTPIVAKRRADPGDDLISLLVTAELEGRRLEDIEIISFSRMLLNAGGETTYRSTGNLLVYLLRHPEQLEEVRNNRELLAAAIEEGLRIEPPLSSISRLAVRDTMVGDLAVAEGTIVEMGIGIANRDPRRWTNPHEFDIHRKRLPHMAFAWGPHTCLGTHLARLEMTTAISALLDRLPGLRLDSTAGREPVIQGIGLRSPNCVPVRFG